MDYQQHNAQLKQQLRSLQLQVVRDLAWCCLSPPLLAGLPSTQVLPQLDPQLEDHLWPWLYQLDKQPEALVNLIQQRKSTRLGLYYETLWQFYFMQHPEWELLAYNQQIYHQGVTLGAFDFLCQRDGEYWHIETAVKFYLCAATADDAASDWHQWIGPNKSDRLDLKLTHLQKHQLHLPQNPIAQEWLETHFPQTNHWRSALCLQGYFFNADESQQPDLAHPYYCRGSWLALDDFLQLTVDISSWRWQLLERHQWLSPGQTDDPKKLLDTAQLKAIAIAKLEGENRPLLVAAMRAWGNVWQEEKRYFLVPNNWPLIASR